MTVFQAMNCLATIVKSLLDKIRPDSISLILMAPRLLLASKF
jgi:hypothetical protein